VHTSTVTVAVLREPTAAEVRVDDRDLEWSTCRGSGPGGQHRNKTESAVIVKHVPTGLQVRCESERSQHQNRANALGVLRARLWEAQQAAADSARAGERKRQVGSGQRGDKVRTVRVQDGIVADHPTDRKIPLRDYLRGDFDFGR
jgi:peptide chain release factor 1